VENKKKDNHKACAFKYAKENSLPRYHAVRRRNKGNHKKEVSVKNVCGEMMRR
jgi:hypothetical protein